MKKLIMALVVAVMLLGGAGVNTMLNADGVPSAMADGCQ